MAQDCGEMRGMAQNMGAGLRGMAQNMGAEWRGRTSPAMSASE